MTSPSAKTMPATEHDLERALYVGDALGAILFGEDDATVGVVYPSNRRDRYPAHIMLPVSLFPVQGTGVGLQEKPFLHNI